MLIKRFFSISGLAISLLTILLTTYTMYVAQTQLEAPFRITISTLCFGLIFITTIVNQRVGIALCLFALPLLPNFTIQVLAFTGYGRVLDQNTPGMDAVAGLLLGSFLNRCFIHKTKDFPYRLPWIGGALMVFITFSTALSICRNLNQTESVGSLSILVYNLIHFRSLGWHHDYRPLFDYVAYGNAFALIAVLVSALKDQSDKNDLIFKPILFGIVVDALVGIIQSQTGKGLQPLQVFFRNDSLGFIALGFQPDIHAFAAHMLIGTIGVIGYLLYTKNKAARILIIGLIMPMAWIGLLLSKSKASLAISIATLITLSLFWIFRHSRYLVKAITVCVCVIVIVGFSIFIFRDTWTLFLTNAVQRIGFTDLNALNFYMAYRPEIFMAGMRMFTEFPILGLGQGDFYRLSAIYPFSQSTFLSSTVNGENAHNYLLQVLVENGALGFALFVLFIAYPLIKTKARKNLIPAYIAILSIILGNIYSHSLLVRENLFIAATFIALAYSWSLNDQHQIIKSPLPFRTNNKLTTLLLIIFGIALITFSIREVRHSFNQYPFKANSDCFTAKPLTEDGWTSGIYEKRLDDGVVSIRLNLKSSQPDVESHPLKGSISIIREKFGSLASKEIIITESGPSFIDIDLLPGFEAVANNHKLVLKLQRCFSPKDPITNQKSKPVGVQVDSFDTKKKSN